MEVIVSTVADAMLSACFRSLCETLSSPDFLKFCRDEQLVAEMNKWQKLLRQMNASLDDAEEKQITSSAVKNWLGELHHVALDAEDVVDELATEALRRKLAELTRQPSVSTNKVWKFFVPSCFRAINLNTIKFDAEIKSKIQVITERLDDLVKGKSFLRESDKDAIIDLLMMDGGEMGEGETGVVSIVGAPESKILVTTRNEPVAACCGGYRHQLNELSNDDCISILTCHALGANNFDEYPNLKAVGEQIATRCKGLPLAAKTVGALLRTKVNQSEWEDILRSKIWDLPGGRNDIIPALRLSYLHLPSRLKRCFAYCAIFPKDNEFDKDELVLLWMAEGFLQQPRGAKSVSGEICFNLDDTDMLECDKLCTAVENTRYVGFTRKQYDVAKRFEVLYRTKKLRTLAALPTCLPTWAACCHLSGDVLQNMLSSNANLKDKDGLTELDLQWSDESFNSGNEEDEMHVLERLMPHKNLEKLRILFYGGKMFPSWLGDPSLTNIVLLELCNCRNSVSLPSLGRLPSLKTLSIVGMDRVRQVGLMFYGHGFPCVKPFPSLEILRFRDMLEWTCWSSPSQANGGSGGEFPCLRQLTVENCPKLIGKLPGLLLSLVKLVIKRCPKLEASSMSFPSLNELNVEDCKEELLSSILWPSSLTTVTTKGLPELQHSQNGVVWSPGALRDLSISKCTGLTSLWATGDILSNITALEHLKIKSCSQFSETGFFPMLKHLTLKDCPGLKFLPSAIMMLSCPLEELEIEDCRALISFGCGRLPTALRRLKIRFCEALDSLPQGLMQIDNSTSGVSRLENLEIIGCPSLISFPEGKFPSSLKMLKIWKCLQLEPLSDGMLPKNASLELISASNFPTMTCLPECLEGLTHLTELSLHKCIALKYFPETGLQLPNLRKLDIYECTSLESLPDQMLRLTSLQYLIIGECPGLEFPKGGWPPNLLELEIWNCENLKQPLSDWNLHDLASLRELTIVGARDIVSFPGEMCLLPTSLRSMYISRLHNLRSLSVGLRDLTLLKELDISKCPKLQCLPKDGLPADLGRLCIRDCQLVKQHCVKGKGAYWPMIAHIPCLEIETTDD
ncbi:hypothetical protein V6N11_035992 [Hibiscus sabdariffa]|uniref:Disease resistance RPP13-like protein 1 n=1 Tax=Hibiscus sabdariffa TaxID=183260 RepID=A0ABR2R926_9ROSI